MEIKEMQEEYGRLIFEMKVIQGRINFLEQEMVKVKNDSAQVATQLDVK